MPYGRSDEEPDEEEPEDALPCRGFGRELEGIIVRTAPRCVFVSIVVECRRVADRKAVFWREGQKANRRSKLWVCWLVLD
jgi:hypothetical protein